MWIVARFLLVAALASGPWMGLVAVEVSLRAPLTTLVPIPGELPTGGKVVYAELTVPADAPADLGVGAFVTDAHGRWFQRLHPGTLAVGRHSVRIELGDDAPAAGAGAAWDAAQAELTMRGGLFFWSAGGSRARIAVDGLRATPLDDRADGTDPRLAELALDGDAHTAERWQLTCRPQPFPDNPYDPDEFALDLLVTTPSGTQERIPGFAELPMRGSDRGDREEVLPTGRARFAVRFRPREPGVHQLRLEGRWSGRTVAVDLAPLRVAGTPWDGYVRVDRGDPRFFTIAGAPFWPVGPNLRAITDPRCTQRLGTKPTPERGTLAYAAFLDRLAPSGANAAEIWLSSWNLALEWRGDWPEFHGVGQYSQERAWRLDRILDLAWAHGLRFNVVINNHGQISEQTDREWQDNPYNTAAGGFLRRAAEFFADSRSLAKQEHLRRYLVARYADHPAVMSWKLLSEQDLTAVGQRRDIDLLARWHQHAAERWKDLDTYDHPITTHWANSYRTVYPQVASLPGIDFLTIDAYHETAIGGAGELLAHLLYASSARRGGLTRYGKPVLVAEYGGLWNACPEPQMIAEHASGGFVALVCGHAGAPMLWWFEWVDQSSRFGPYRALTDFLAGEDLRNPQALSLALPADDAEAPAAALWCRAWSRPGRMLGYLLDERWQANGSDIPTHTATTVLIGEQIAAGAVTISWWDADAGREIVRQELVHPGGVLRLTPPPWKYHLAFKLWRP